MYPILTLKTAPNTEPVSLSDAKKHARVIITADDDYITSLISSARQKFESESGYFLADAQYEATYKDAPHHEFVLPLRPVASVDSVNSLTEGTDYTVTIDALTQQATIKLLTPVSGSLVIDFHVGGDAPTLACHALKTLVSHWYESRESYEAGSSFKAVPAGYESIVRNFRLA